MKCIVCNILQNGFFVTMIDACTSFCIVTSFQLEILLHFSKMGKRKAPPNDDPDRPNAFICEALRGMSLYFLCFRDLFTFLG